MSLSSAQCNAGCGLLAHHAGKLGGLLLSWGQCSAEGGARTSLRRSIPEKLRYPTVGGHPVVLTLEVLVAT